MTSRTKNKFSQEVRELAVRMVLEHEARHPSRWARAPRLRHGLARCAVARPMRGMGLQGVIGGRAVRTTIGDKAAPCPLDHVNRQFKAPRPDALRVSGSTHAATWPGVVHVASIIDACARRVVGRRVSRSAHAGFALDALGQALHERRRLHRGGLVHHSDRAASLVSTGRRNTIVD